MRPIVTALLAALAFVPMLGTLVSSASAQDGTWSTKASAPTARFGQAAGVIAGKWYVTGGCCVANAPPFLRFHQHEVYDPLTNTWGTKAALPFAVYGAAAGVIGTKLYVAGGQASQTDGGDTARLQVYDAVTDSWTERAPLPFTMSAAGGTVIDGKLYVAAGVTTPQPYLTTLHVYDPDTNAWTAKAQMSVGRHFPAVAAINGILYVAGGEGSTGQPVAVLEAYDPATNTWTTKAPMLTARNGAVATVLDGLLYVIGGRDANESVDTVEAYDPATNTWAPRPPMPTARMLPAAATIGDVSHAVGGFRASDFLQFDVLEAFFPTLSVIIDIKPGSDPNSINLASSGVVPVAILSSSTFDATKVNPESVTLAGAAVRLIGRGNRYACNKSDVNADGLLDLVCHVETAQFMLEPGAGSAILTGTTFGGQKVRGEDSIRIVP